MKPVMNQSITIEIPTLDDKGRIKLNDYGQPLTKKVSGKCRVVENGEVRRNEMLAITDASDEIDVLPNFPIVDGAKVTYTTIGGITKNGTIKTHTETTNLTANKVYYRTLIVDA
ncbi:TPA: hypothetical protein REH32_001224 [Staphylococcus pseudintermedius]|nr:hypothetical protein [Staphylococcus pseudintermedius]